MSALTTKAGQRAAEDFIAPDRLRSNLIDEVKAVCARLAPLGWAALFRTHGLNIEAADLSSELARPLSFIDREQPGFGDFCTMAIRGIEPARPALSLLYHALASPAVHGWSDGGHTHSITSYPTLYELELIENYVYATKRMGIADLRAAAGDRPLALVVFAYEYRTGHDTVHKRHADLCYSRTGVARIGTEMLHYVGSARAFSNQAGRPDAIAVQPCRYAAFVAVLADGEQGTHGPMQFVDTRNAPDAGPASNSSKDAGSLRVEPALKALSGSSDTERKFWLPLHKLFGGAECLSGVDVDVKLAAVHINEKLRRAHLYFGAAGHDSGWSEPDISHAPFIFRDGIATFTCDAVHGSWLVVPTAHPSLVEAAAYQGKPLTFRVPESKQGDRWTVYQSSLNLERKPSGARAAPEYLHARHRFEDGKLTSMNAAGEVSEEVRKGKYEALHYLDYTGDGWVSVHCAALAMEIPRCLAAYSLVASPDYFPAVRQSDLTRWTDQSVPPRVLRHIWPPNPGRPEPLSSQRVAANLELKGAAFNSSDDTMTAIVGSFGSGKGPQARLTSPGEMRASMLPDGAAGVFAPGWDVSFDRTEEQDSGDNGAIKGGVTFLANYGLGSPFPEDAMLCAALSSFWPAVAPDITRTFAPNPRYATATPLTDEVIGIGGTPWDGVVGPRAGPRPDTLEYKQLAYGDYVEAALHGSFNYRRLDDVSTQEYLARTLVMALVYEALGVTERVDKARWSVLSFVPAVATDPLLQEALASTSRLASSQHTYRFEMVRHDGASEKHPNPAKFDHVVVPYKERVVLFADPTMVLRQAEPDGPWDVAVARSI